uniref:Putative death-receptor fusion protein n=1 Tax=Culex tarsalis TaxID=7177 RepID=A0A1Q3F166_CULTA
MNLFRREFQSCKDLNILLVLMLQISTEVELETSSIALLVETLVHHITTPSASIHPSTSVFYIFKLKEYILQNLSVPSSIIGATFVAQSAKLLSHIASLSLDRYEQNEDAYAIVSELMGSSVFHQHLQKQAAPESNYHAIITSLKMFQCFASLFLEFTAESPYRLQEKVDEGVEAMTHLLPVEADTFYDMIYTVEHLLVSEFDDVKATALKLLYNKTFAYHYGPALQGRLSLIYSYKNPSAVLEAMISFFDESHIALLSSLRDHERDLFAMMKNDAAQLYNQIDAITEAFFGYTESRTLRILDDIRAFPKMLILVNRVVEFVLRSLNCAKTDEQRLMVGSTFEIMDNSLQLLLERSSQRSTNLAADKKTMMVAMWKALRSAGSFLENYAMWTLDNYRNRLDTIDHLSICLRAFIMMLLNCCHRGAIESAGVGFGRVIKKIAALKECLVVRNDHRNRQAKRIVELAERMFRALVRLDLQESDFRRCRGYLWLIHNFIKSDSNSNAERAYLKIYIEMHRMPVNGMLVPANAHARISVLQLHQLNLMVREATMNETILEYIDDLMIIALERFKSPDWTMRNAALQLYSSIVTKLVGQRQMCSDPDCNWPIVYVSLNEIIFKLTKSTKYILKELRRTDRVPTPFLILVLEFLAKVEYRAYNVPGQKATVVDFRIQMWRFLSHENDQVRILAATCFTQLHEFHDEIPRMMENLIIIFFTARGNENFRHGLLKAIHFCIRKYVTNARFVGASKEDFLAQMRQLMETYSVLDTAMVSSYRLRYHLLDLLLYLGFAKMDRTVVSQVFHKLAPSNHGLNVFLMKTNALYNSRSLSPVTSDLPMEYEVIIESSDKQSEFGGCGGGGDVGPDPDED